MRIRASLVASLSLLLAGVSVPAVAQPAAPDEHGPTAHPSGPTGAVKSELAVLAPAAPITLGAHPVTVVVPIPPSGRGQMAVTAGPAAPATLLLSVDGIKFEKTPEGYFEIYIKLPQ